MKTKRKENIPEKLKEKVASRFNNKCYFCDIPIVQHDTGKEFHHFICESSGGKTSYDNLVLCCHDCHIKLHRKTKMIYSDIRHILYDALLRIFSIYPINRELDDDLIFVKKLIDSGKKTDYICDIPFKQWEQIYFFMKYIDCRIGGIFNEIRVKEVFKIFPFVNSIDNGLIENTLMNTEITNLKKTYKELTGNSIP